MSAAMGDARIVSITTARNEADIVEAFVRHHAPLVERMIIVCHFCQDRTPELLALLKGEGLPLDVRLEPEPVFRQQALRTSLLDELSSDGPDWILPLDVDEFLVAAPGASLTATLAELAAGEVHRLPWLTYVPTREDDLREQNVLKRIRHRAGPRSGKVIVSKDLSREGTHEPSRGGHRWQKRSGGGVSEGTPVEALALAHFPVRSHGQLRAKVLGGWPCMLADPELHVGMASHWQALYEELSLERVPTFERLQEIARDYCLAPGTTTGDELVLDPVHVSFELRYTPEPPDPQEILARTAEGLARAHRDALHPEQFSSVDD